MGVRHPSDGGNRQPRHRCEPCVLSRGLWHGAGASLTGSWQPSAQAPRTSEPPWGTPRRRFLLLHRGPPGLGRPLCAQEQPRASTFSEPVAVLASPPTAPLRCLGVCAWGGHLPAPPGSRPPSCPFRTQGGGGPENHGTGRGGGDREPPPQGSGRTPAHADTGAARGLAAAPVSCQEAGDATPLLTWGVPIPRPFAAAEQFQLQPPRPSAAPGAGTCPRVGRAEVGQEPAAQQEGQGGEDRVPLEPGQLDPACVRAEGHLYWDSHKCPGPAGELTQNLPGAEAPGPTVFPNSAVRPRTDKAKPRDRT
ncbi:translation initiation factor IF-2-like [Myotis myotis]|uniref:Uncharacterized protein n=1 Tax=Myotis myotis TaxID=51298 RepID=A0A7J7QYS6_MYOMY|nr:translation initiation factor IF-2-like [Myotis myotis]XP_036162805.1 translation initiation factor IF-2-like [Myotis myotis]KAF6269081.1 hypothetical protein mMyoMyo1_011266 [Myotis myotis]